MGVIPFMKLSKKILHMIETELVENEGFDPEIARLSKEGKDLSKLNSLEKDRWIEKTLFLLPTTRNRLLITSQEQKKLRKKIVTVFGLSVGSHAASAWIMESRANTIKISDPDIVSPTNLNRLDLGWGYVGLSKVEIVKNRLKEINPNCRVVSSQETSLENMKSLILSKPKSDLIVDQIDDIQGKVWIRNIAKKNKIPVIMATDVGDKVFLDVERYDNDFSVLPFNGRVKGIESIDFSNLTREEKIKLVIQIVGVEHNSERMLRSLASIGKSIKTWPQLGTTAVIAGGLVAKTIRKILLGEKIESKRYYFSIEELLVADYNSKKRIKLREELSKEITKNIPHAL